MTYTAKTWDSLPHDSWASCVDIAKAINGKENTVRTTLNALARAGFADVQMKLNAVGKEVRFYKRSARHAASRADTAAKAISKIRLGPNSKSRMSFDHAPAPEKSTRVLIAVEVPGAETMTLDMAQAKHVYESLREVFG